MESALQVAEDSSHSAESSNPGSELAIPDAIRIIGLESVPRIEADLIRIEAEMKRERESAEDARRKSRHAEPIE